MNNLDADSINFDNGPTVKLQKNNLSIFGEQDEENISANYNINNNRSWLNFLGSKKMLIINIILLAISTSLLFSVLFGLVPHSVHFENIKQELNHTKMGMVQCSTAHGQMQDVAHQLDAHLTQCSNEVDALKFNLTSCRRDLESVQSVKRMMDDHMTRLKDQVATLTTSLRIKDENFQLLQQSLQEKAMRSSPDADRWYSSYSTATLNRSLLTLLLLPVYFTVTSL